MVACPSFLANHADLCVAVDRYCERTSAAFDAEPINALTNIGFLVAAWAAWRLHRRHRTDHDGLITALIVNVAIIGIGSFAFHTLATRGARLLDIVPIVIFMLFYLWTVMTLLLTWPTGTKLVALSGYVALMLLLDVGSYVPALSSGAMYVPTILVMIAACALLSRHHVAAARAFSVALAVFLLSFAMRSLDMPLCTSWPIGTHFLWHLLNAVLLYLLVRLVILHGPRSRQQRAPAGVMPW